MVVRWSFPPMNRVFLGTVWALPFLLPTLAFAEDDHIKASIKAAYRALMGTPGDLTVGMCIFGALIMLWRRYYRSAVGFIFLLCGIVVIRVLTEVFFDVEEFLNERETPPSTGSPALDGSLQHAGQAAICAYCEPMATILFSKR